MGRQKANREYRVKPAHETHEPNPPLPGWPRSHVDSVLTGMDKEECVEVTIHGVDHFLHATTARELSNRLLETLDAYNENMRQQLADPKSRAVLEKSIKGMVDASGHAATLDDLYI